MAKLAATALLCVCEARMKGMVCSHAEKEGLYE